MDEILNLIESVSEGFPFYFHKYALSAQEISTAFGMQLQSLTDSVRKLQRTRHVRI